MAATIAAVRTLPNELVTYEPSWKAVVLTLTPSLVRPRLASACCTSLVTAVTLAPGSFWITRTRPCVPLTSALPMSGWWLVTTVDTSPTVVPAGIPGATIGRTARLPGVPNGRMARMSRRWLPSSR